MGKCCWLDKSGNCKLEKILSRQDYHCERRASECKDYLENEIGEPTYDIGDEVWTLCIGKWCQFPSVIHCKVKNIDRVPGGFLLYEVWDIGSCGCAHHRTGFSLFPTKEAMKEYYMKIFD